MEISTLSTQEILSRLAAFEQKCRRSGLRVTNQRREIFKAVATSRMHLSAEEVFETVRRKINNVSLDTVYRTLTSLEQMDLLIRVGTAQKERFDGDLRPHAHFICNRCGFVQDIFPPDVSCEVKPAVLNYGEVKHVNIQFKGICKRCESERTVF